MNLALLTEQGCCYFTQVFGGGSVAMYGDISAYSEILLIDKNIHCILWAARGVAFVQTSAASVPMETASIKKKSAKFLCALAGA